MAKHIKFKKFDVLVLMHKQLKKSTNIATISEKMDKTLKFFNLNWLEPYSRKLKIGRIFPKKNNNKLKKKLTSNSMIKIQNSNNYSPIILPLIIRHTLNNNINKNSKGFHNRKNNIDEKYANSYVYDIIQTIENYYNFFFFYINTKS